MVKNTYSELSLDSYPHFSKQYNEYEEEFNNLKSLYNKFNGNLVRELTSLEGKELGKFIQSFKSKYTDELVLKMTEEEVKNNILLLYKNLTE